ncbi:2-oxo acid dehydrogenase subunit E2 [Actinocrinis puniceicyclus]|uniref:2-oxo acid dehydrogenase subunit E2 n=1 Tax=Actinocrinis puniceicyclus TaxID=977794 RepID=UPI0034D9806C
MRALPRQRRHTLHFLAGLRDFAPVFLDTEVDMGAVLEHRAAARADQHSYSVSGYVLHTAARVLAAHPEANGAIRGRLRPRVARYGTVNGKLAFDRTLGGVRVVLTAVLPDLANCSLDEIQQQVDRLRDGDPEQLKEFAGARMLHKLPVPNGRLLSRMATRPLRRRAALLGTFAVSSLGHRPIDGFYSIGGTTVTLGLGQIAQRPVARGSAVVIAPVLRLSLTFDHRVIDGAEAADVLAEIKTGLENFPAVPDAGHPAPPATREPAAAGAEKAASRS